MKTKVLLKIVLLLLVALQLTACAKHNTDNYFDKTSYAVESVYESIKNKDADGIKKLLCDRLRNLPDVDQQIENFFDSIDGNVISADLESETVEKSSSSKDAYEYTEISAIGEIPSVITDTGKKYKTLYVFYTYIDKEKPDIEGIYCIVLATSSTDDGICIEMPKSVQDAPYSGD